MYKAVEYFTDLQDNNHAYNVGDTYPRKGYVPTDERIAELAGNSNVRGRAVIEEVVETVVVNDEEEKPRKRKHKD